MYVQGEQGKEGNDRPPWEEKQLSELWPTRATESTRGTKTQRTL